MTRAVRIAAALLAVSAGGAPAAAEEIAPPIVRHDVVARLDPATSGLEVVDTVRFGPVPGSQPVRFLLHKDLAVRTVAHADDARAVWREQDRWFPRHFWRRPPYGDLDGFETAREIEVDPPAGGWRPGGASLRVEYAGVVADSLHEPEHAYGRSFETTSGRIVPQGAYLTGETHWVPWSSDALFAFDLTVDVPPDWRVVSQGELRSDDVRGAARHVRWVASSPTDQVYVVAGPYELHEVLHGDVRVLAFTYAGTGPDVFEPYLDATGPALDAFSGRYGAYPYPSFALVENYWQTGFGMPGFTLLGDRVVRLPFIVHTSFPHEILHNWWGNGVYLARGEGNWCEGLTTYGADYAAKEAEGEAAARDYRRSTLQAYRDFAVGGGADFALRAFRERDSAATQAVGYGKTLLVFHMLRRRLGPERFDAALRRFFERNRFRRAGWNELREAFEQEEGGSLDAFFTQWVERAGAARLALEGVRVVEDGDRRRVVGVIRQEEPAYELSVPVVVTGADGARTEVDVPADGAVARFEVPVDFRPGRLALDPEFHLFRLLAPEEVPSALSGVLGRPMARIVIGAEAGDAREGLRAAAAAWAKDSTVVVVEEDDAGPEFEGATWCFGDGPLARRLGTRLAEVPAAEGTTVVAADGDTGFLLPAAGADAEAIARKVPHYSRYSWLVFDGTTNVDKGLWEAGVSPLAVEFE